jgi:primosomal protein N'
VITSPTTVVSDREALLREADAYVEALREAAAAKVRAVLGSAAPAVWSRPSPRGGQLAEQQHVAAVSDQSLEIREGEIRMPPPAV